MARPPFEILEHTADVGLKIRGATLPELFSNAGQGLMALAFESVSAEPRQRLSLRAEGADYEDLLVCWLSEILYFVDTEGWMFSGFVIHSVEQNKLVGEALGERSDPAERVRAVAVKAVTYHQVSVRHVPEGWEAVVYFDI
ncbi:MAG: archease [Acidobacteria bacterium]|nr:archease [Acidobacteriota bacterium]